jgi:hypothetical protein
VRCWAHDAVLNDATAQAEMLSWLGVERPVLVLGEVHNSSQPSPGPRHDSLAPAIANLRSTVSIGEAGEHAGMELMQPKAGAAEATPVDRDSLQQYSSSEAWLRWHTRRPRHHIDYSLGYPVAVSDVAPQAATADTDITAAMDGWAGRCTGDGIGPY